MYIKRAKVYGFGSLVEQSFEFDTELNVIYGPNEAGKSTLLAFLTSILFGFATKKRASEQYIPKDSGRYGGEVLLQEGSTQYLIRRTEGKNGGELVCFANDQQIDNDVFLNILKPLTKDLFRALFVFDTRSMLTIESLDKEALVTQILAIGAVNSGDWLKRSAALEKQAGQLYKPTGKKPEINQRLVDLQDIRLQISKQQAKLPQYEAIKTQLRQSEAQLQTIKSNYQIKTQQLRQLDKLEQLWPLYQQYQALKTSDQTNQKLSVTELQQLFDQYQQLQTKIDYQIQTMEQRRTETLSHVDSDSFYGQHLQDFQEIEQQLPHIQAQVARRKTLQTRIQENQLRLNTLKRDNPAITLDMQPISVEDLSTVSQLNAQIKNSESMLQQTSQSLMANQLQQTEVLRALDQIKVPVSEDQSVSAAENNNFLNGLVVFGGLLFIVGLFLPSFVKTLSLVGLGIIGLSIYQKRQVRQYDADAAAKAPDAEADPKSQQQSRLNELKKQADQLKINQQKSQQTLKQQQQQLTQIEQQYNLTPNQDLLKVQPLLTEMHQLDHESHKQQQELAQLNQQLVTFDDLTAFLKSDLGQYSTFSEAYFNVLKQQLSDYQDYVTESQESAVIQEQLQSWLKQQKVELADLKWQQQQILQQADLSDFSELQTQLETAKKATNDQERRRFLNQQLENDLPALAKYQKIEDLRTQKQAVQQDTEQIKQRRTKQQSEIQDLNVQLMHLATDNQLQQLQQQQANLEAEIVALTQQYLTAEMSAQWIRSTLSAASEDRYPQIIAKATRYFSILTLDKYQKIMLENDSLTVQTKDNLLFDVRELSLGTMEQLFLAIRLAFMQTMSDLVQMPVFLDDVLVNADTKRLQQMIQLIQEISQTNQVFFTTAHDAFMQELSAKHVIKMTDTKGG
ncbi:AAA family ATPase [Lactobacillus sp. CC-MHH1034]|uniref:ATP-binding protein n=1 Tax=Agrilactobacillus fermenti TaxID=2586909 RepID=UPI001E3A7C3E|nr:AAA family ATPase [Agrilactobacillus fermenti]MCD2256642.1 AAA family ATPase [Agrilactobacillus fermenti]